MSKTYTPAPFFSDEIRIKAHTATHADHIGRPLNIREFAGEQTVSLEKEESGDYYCRRQDGDFIEGPEV